MDAGGERGVCTCRSAVWIAPHLWTTGHPALTDGKLSARGQALWAAAGPSGKGPSLSLGPRPTFLAAFCGPRLNWRSARDCRKWQFSQEPSQASTLPFSSTPKGPKARLARLMAALVQREPAVGRWAVAHSLRPWARVLPSPRLTWRAGRAGSGEQPGWLTLSRLSSSRQHWAPRRTLIWQWSGGGGPGYGLFSSWPCFTRQLQAKLPSGARVHCRSMPESGTSMS